MSEAEESNGALRITPKWAAVLISIIGSFIAGGVSFIYIQFQVNANTSEIIYRRPDVYSIPQIRQRLKLLEDSQKSLVGRVDEIQREQLRRSRRVWQEKSN